MTFWWFSCDFSTNNQSYIICLYFFKQTATQIINEGSQKCLDVSGSSGEGNILVYNCQNYDDQYFYFRSRGSELKFGRLQNEESDLCLDVTGSNGQGDVGMYNCQDQEDQWFRFYENGEIVNEKSRYCLDVSGSGSGNVLTYSCQDATDQMWSMPTTYCNGDYCSFVNQQSSKCLDVSGVDGTGNVLEYECQAISDQRFKWIADKWETPTATWNNVGCNQNGNVQRTVSSSLTTSASITSTLTLEVTSTIGANTKFASASVSTKIAASLAVAFSTSRTWTESVTYECENYDNGDDFTGGCMWQLQVDTKHISTNQGLTWVPNIVKCTSSTTAPTCPPFTKCTNAACTGCIDV